MAKALARKEESGAQVWKSDHGQEGSRVMLDQYQYLRFARDIVTNPFGMKATYDDSAAKIANPVVPGSHPDVASFLVAAGLRHLAAL